MKSKTCCFSGHRNIPADKEEEIKIKLNKELEKLINKGYCFFAVGGALGFDTMAAIEVLNLRRKYPHIKLIMVLPCKDQSKYWNKADKNIYEFIKKQSDKVVYTSQYYKDKSCILDRNRLLIDNSSVCITYKTKNTGGTSYTINYAKEKNIKIINLA